MQISPNYNNYVVYYLNGLTEGETYKLISPSDTKLSSRLVFSLLDEELGVLAQDIDMELFGFDLIGQKDEENEKKKKLLEMMKIALI